jgi:hypothetical protein
MFHINGYPDNFDPSFDEFASISPVQYGNNIYSPLCPVVNRVVESPTMVEVESEYSQNRPVFPRIKFLDFSNEPESIASQNIAISKVSCWFFFFASLNTSQDVGLIKEILFWTTIYHSADSKIRIFTPVSDKSSYLFYQRAFNVSEVPCMILAEKDTYPNDFITFDSSFLSEKTLGKGFVQFANVMEKLHNQFILDGNLSAIKTDDFMKKLGRIVSKTWEEIKGLIKISIL